MIDAFALGERLVPRERALRERRRADRHHAEHCYPNTGQLQQIASTDMDADLVFEEPPSFELLVHV